jgi:hypothetical protein
MSQAFGIFSRGHTTFELGKPLKTYVFPIGCSPKATFNISEVAIAFFHSSKQHFMQTLFFQGCHFHEPRMEKHTLVIKKTLNHHTYYICIPSRK